MAADDVFPAEMPDRQSHPIPPLDDDTAERLLAGRLDPDDAPPYYADVARLVRAASAPADPDELGWEEAALALFRMGRAGVGGVSAGGGGEAGLRGRPARVRGRLAAVALAGLLVVGGTVGGAAAGGLLTTDGVPSSGRLRSPTGGLGAGAAGSGAPGVGAKPVPAPEATAGKAKAPRPGKPKAHKPAPKAPKPGKKAQKPAPKGPKGPKAAPGQGANQAGGKRK
jgi:hypothetical protein